MKKLDQFTNQYGLQKTLCFSLLPMGETESFLNERLLVQNDEVRAENAFKVKEYMDRYHKSFIEASLTDVSLSDLDRYAELYFNGERSDEEKEEMSTLEDAYRCQIADAFQNHPDFKKLFGKEMLSELLPKFLTDDEEKAVVATFKSFTTFFYDFFTARKNLYMADSGACSIPHRCIEDNLPIFLGNTKAYALVKGFLPQADLKQLSHDLIGLFDCEIEEVFTPSFFNRVLSQTEIDLYNTVIGGYSACDGSKVKGLNEYINLYNQKIGAGDKKIPLFKHLKKQILSDRETISFVAEQFKTDEEVLSAINDFCTPSDTETLSLGTVMDRLKALATNIRSYDPCCIFVAGKDISTLSNSALGSWKTFQAAWEKEYDTKSEKKNKATNAYIEQRAKEFKKIKSFSLDRIQEVFECIEGDRKYADIADFFTKEIRSAIGNVVIAYDEVSRLLTERRDGNKKLANDNDSIFLIRELLEAVKDLERLVKLLLGTGKEADRDASFYNELQPLYEKLATMDRLYDRVRNYITKKPYSKEKVKLTFNLGDFFSGWAQDFTSKGTHVIRRGEEYFLMIVEKTLTPEDLQVMEQGDEGNTAIRYRYHFVKPDMKNVPRMFIRSRKDLFAPAIAKYNLPVHEILDIYDKGLFKTEYAKKDPAGQKAALKRVIDYFKLCFERHESYSSFVFNWRPSEEYSNIAEFYQDAERACYKLTEHVVNLDGIYNLVKDGKVYLFRFNNKDFSAYSKGKPNMHTLYFKTLFSEENLSAPLFKLNGGAEMFYRKASISDADKIVHPALYPIENKNPNNEKGKSVFEYDIVKDRRFTRNQYSVHIPITLNFGVAGSDMEINKKVRAAIKSANETYVIGIDRGEKNLIFATIIDGKGRVVEQRSFNIIRNVNYHSLLESKENERQKARQDWTTINNIKNIKEGYISCVVREICDLVLKYDAIIAMEDLGAGFKSSRAKIEKQVYQKFEKMLIDKLNFLAMKDRAPTKNGGLLRAYQLTSRFKSFDEMRGQNGIIFYVPAWFTSKTDPSTGFASLFQTKYTSVKDAKAFFGCFREIRYNADEDFFEFSFDYSSFNYKTADFTNSWIVCTNGDRVHNFINPEDGKWMSKNVVLTPAFKQLFDSFDVDCSGNMKKAICDRNEKDFFEKLLTLFSLTVQIRNSYIGDVDHDFVISPCKDKNGKFFDSRDYKHVANATMPASADANDAYNVARKGLWVVSVIKDTPDDLLPKVSLSISNKDWLRFAQTSKI